MITGAHFLFYSKNPEADRAFFRDVLGFCSVDVGEGWLIFAMPPTEAAMHPLDGNSEFSHQHAGQDLLGAVLYLMCDDLQASIAWLKEKDVSCTEVQNASLGHRNHLSSAQRGQNRSVSAAARNAPESHELIEAR